MTTLRIHHKVKNCEDAIRQIAHLQKTSYVESEEFIEFDTWKDISYKDLVEKLIRQKYSVSDELALLRQQLDKPNEYESYYSFVEECKAQAKQLIDERENALQGERN